MIQIENTFFQLGESCSRNCLIICDRGAMDASACEFENNQISLNFSSPTKSINNRSFSVISKDKWELMMASNGWNNVELRDNR